jgi:hypothetical protein
MRSNWEPSIKNEVRSLCLHRYREPLRAGLAG